MENLDLIGIISATVAVIAAMISLVNLRESRRIAKYSENSSLVFQTESLALKHKNLIKLHNITEEMLEEVNATAEEVIYLSLSINASRAFCQIQKKVELSEFRKNMFKNKKVIMIWRHIIRGRLVSSDSSYAKVVDKYMDEIDS